MLYWPIIAYFCYALNAPWWCWACFWVIIISKLFSMLIKTFDAGVEYGEDKK